ncbi:MAG: class I SAM-dependent methyltransferase [Ktedonobacteraceae bacterium]
MPASENPSSAKSTYVIEAENAAEMARLTTQDRLVTKAMGGPFPPQLDLSSVQTVLDIACGPGGWVFDVAMAYPRLIVTGIDMSELMVAYAQSQAQVQQLSNARFKVMNALKPLDFPDNSFDFINARLLFGFMPPTAWLPLLGECQRILRSGGILRLTEGEAGITNSPATERITGMITQSLYQARQSFSPDGRHTGITPMLSRLQRDAGFEHIQQAAHMMDYSQDTEAHAGMYQNFMVGYKLIQPFLLKMDMITPEEMDRVYQQMLIEMAAEDFCAAWFLLSVWGQKPL